MGGTSTPRARALGDAIRDVRTAAGIGVRELARRVDISHTTISRYESGQRSPSPEDVAVILGALGVNGEPREELLALAREPDRQHWLGVGMTEQQRQLATLLGYEQTATRIVDVSPLLIPGLLQTADYARAIMRDGEVPIEEIETRVAVRLGRQNVLTRRTPAHLVAVIGEAVLGQLIGGRSVMCDQLRHLQAMVDRPNVDLRVIPIAAGWSPASEGPFILVELASGSPVVHLETRISGLFLHDRRDVGAYEVAVDRVLRVAMSADETADLIAREADRREKEVHEHGSADLAKE
ncbi:helix-turn-helix domain-containing protein [Actinokineospora sp.]|uniref:helix-turn-helix domain-containing protein n=1 Tax=Actinokineospora sp. TaxID=1872133 RepID=UPI003D6ACB09